MSDEQRTSLEAQVGYLTAQLDGLKDKMQELSDFVKDHMNKEEKKFQVIDNRFEKMYKWFILLSFIIVADSAGFPLEKLIQLLLHVV